MTQPKPRTLTHPEGGQTESDIHHLDAYLAEGWVEQDDKPAKTD